MSIDLDRARKLLFAGYTLQRTETPHGPEFVIPTFGPVTTTVAMRLIAHPLIREVDPGLLPGLSQSWSLSRQRR